MTIFSSVLSVRQACWVEIIFFNMDGSLDDFLTDIFGTRACHSMGLLSCFSRKLLSADMTLLLEKQGTISIVFL